MIYRGPVDPIPAQDDPAQVWRRLFSELNVAPPTGAPVVDQAREQRKSVLDFVRGEYTRLGATVGARDREKLDAHATFLREVEQRLAATTASAPTAGCGKPAQPAALTVTDPRLFPAIARLQMDMLAMALACDLTRVISLQMSWARSDVAMTWLGQTLSHHDMSHDQTQPNDKLTAVNKWYAEQVLYLVNALGGLKEAGGSVLDSSVVWWCSEISFGPRHSFTNLRAFLFGSCGGYFKTGQHVATTNTTDNQLMVSFMQAMGLDANQFGDPTIPTGPITTPGVRI
jgi:hypothetical protein